MILPKENTTIFEYSLPGKNKRLHWTSHASNTLQRAVTGIIQNDEIPNDARQCPTISSKEIANFDKGNNVYSTDLPTREIIRKIATEQFLNIVGSIVEAQFIFGILNTFLQNNYSPDIPLLNFLLNPAVVHIFIGAIAAKASFEITSHSISNRLHIPKTISKEILSAEIALFFRKSKK
jgi:hypothetical protein